MSKLAKRIYPEVAKKRLEAAGFIVERKFLAGIMYANKNGYRHRIYIRAGVVNEARISEIINHATATPYGATSPTKEDQCF